MFCDLILVFSSILCQFLGEVVRAWLLVVYKAGAVLIRDPSLHISHSSEHLSHLRVALPRMQLRVDVSPLARQNRLPSKPTRIIACSQALA